MATFSVLQVSKHEQEKESQPVENFARNENQCTLCEEFAAKAVDYFAENKTQTGIINLLHSSCSHLHSFEEECISVVDYYVPLFFLEISTIQPADFCQKFNLCQRVAIFSSQLREDSCELCRHTVSEVLTKLKDPDTQLEIIEVLLKACNSVDKFAKKCKKLVFEYGPLILANTEQFLETTDICTILHACKSSTSTADANDAAAGVVHVLADS
ncbi:hypothetical protein WN944_004346 [Citrus x changshan-huyou]|uniref:Pulmonary surfactant-associated protein B n=1 Tax=Citrus x changshan-huyou TaxID=2935761 RepID=A0AAP0QIU9_9ROSI